MNSIAYVQRQIDTILPRTPSKAKAYVDVLEPCDIVVPPISAAKNPKMMAVMVFDGRVEVIVVSSTWVCGYA